MAHTTIPPDPLYLIELRLKALEDPDANELDKEMSTYEFQLHASMDIRYLLDRVHDLERK